MDRRGRLEFHVLGRVDSALDGIVVDHGTYQRDEFADLARQIAPTFVGLFSTTAESHSFVLSESWSAGIPVLASNLGALQERVERHGGGWIIDINDPKATYRRILEIAADREGYEEQLAKTRDAAVALRSVDEMAADYAALYGELLQQRRSFPAVSKSDTSILRIGAFMPLGADGSFTAASHVRIIRRLNDPGIAEHVVWHAADVDRFLATDPSDSRLDIALVQRNAIPSKRVDAFVDRCRHAGIPIIFDIDDDLLNEDPAWTERDHYQPFRHSMETLAAAASVVTVSTPALVERFAGYNTEVVVLPNALDQSLWLQSVDSNLRLPALRVPRHARPRLVYFGGPTHGGDLEIIKPAVQLIRGNIGSGVQLSVIGGVPPSKRAAWFRAVEIPGDRDRYPQFAPWVRSLHSKFDIGLAPLDETPLNTFKSDLRFLEYGAMGLPGVYSKAEAFATVEDGVTGLVVDNTPEAWEEAIVRLWNDAELRYGIGERALRYVAGERLISQQSEEYLALLRSVRDLDEALAR
jgi:glycosyltransferase involved in cell wall biosynthesis